MSNLQKFNTTLADFDKEVGKLKAVSNAYQRLQSLIDINNEIINQFENNSNALADINEQINLQQLKVENYLMQLSTLVEDKTDQLRKENKEFYKELEGTIKIKLNDNKSEIKQLIEIERNQIKQIFEIEFAKNTKELSQIIESGTDEQTQILLNSQKGIKIILWVLGSISIILSGLAVLKLWI